MTTTVKVAVGDRDLIFVFELALIQISDLLGLARRYRYSWGDFRLLRFWQAILRFHHTVKLPITINIMESGRY